MSSKMSARAGYTRANTISGLVKGTELGFSTGQMVRSTRACGAAIRLMGEGA
jgi:shikimate kinase